MAVLVFLAVDPALLGDPDGLPLPLEESEHCQLHHTHGRYNFPPIQVSADRLYAGYHLRAQRHIVEHTSISWPVPSTISALRRPVSTRSSRLRQSRFRDTTPKQHEKTEIPNPELPRRLVATRLSNFAARHSRSFF